MNAFKVMHYTKTFVLKIVFDGTPEPECCNPMPVYINRMSMFSNLHWLREPGPGPTGLRIQDRAWVTWFTLLPLPSHTIIC